MRVFPSPLAIYFVSTNIFPIHVGRLCFGIIFTLNKFVICLHSVANDLKVCSLGHFREVTAPPGTIENLSLAVGVRLALPRGEGDGGSPSILR